jgi:alpha-glucoside transport system permease protein
MNQILTAAIVVLVVPVILVAYIVLMEWVVSRFPRHLQGRARPWLWLAPALTFVGVFLIYPTIATVFRSFYGRNENNFVGVENYINFFQREDTLIALRNNVIWLVVLTALVVGIGLAVAVLVDRVKYESVVKTVIFLPMAVSFVAASVIWRFMYELNPSVGTLNAVVNAVGGEPQAWLVGTGPLNPVLPLNTFMLIVVGVWMMTGFAMVILSAGLKGISVELLEAARVDGANEVQVFRRIVLPLLAPTIAVIATTVIIFALKTFDVVYVMTNGNFGTEVMANRMYKELFNFGQAGRSAAIAVILFVAIIPVMLLNIKRFRQQEAIR